MVLGITGTNGAGKGAVVNHLIKKGFAHYSVREHIIAELHKQNLPIDRPHMSAIGNELREKHGAGYFVEFFLADAIEKGRENIVIESLRSVGEAESLQEKGGFLIAVTADRRVRYERIVVRASETDSISFAKFCEQEDVELTSPDRLKHRVTDVIQMADYRIENNGMLDELHEQIDLILGKISLI